MKHQELIGDIMPQSAEREMNAAGYCRHPTANKVLDCPKATIVIYDCANTRKLDLHPECGSTRREPGQPDLDQLNTPVIRERTQDRNLRTLQRNLKDRLKEVKPK